VLAALLVAGALLGLYMAWNIGANDVANAMGTSVGSRALTLRKALIVAAVFEFGGAFFVGAPVTETMQKGIVDVDSLGDPVHFAVVMLAALFAAGVWLQVATWKGLPVSTTHAIVGGLAGGGLAAAGPGGVDWRTLTSIGTSWVISPLAGALLGFVTFWSISRGIINSRAPRYYVRRVAPYLAGLVVGILTLSMLFKGLKNLHLDLPLGAALAATAPVSVAGGLGARWWVHRSRRPTNTVTRFSFVERQFGWLQIMTACYVAFAHGANDVANAVGPVAGLWSAWLTGEVSSVVAVPAWMLAAGGFGIVIGLATWGYKVMETIGHRITELTPSRGFSAEFAAATTVLVCSKMGLPISTTHTLVGAVIGVGLARGIAALDMRVLRDIVSSWILTVPVAAGLAAAASWALLRVLG